MNQKNATYWSLSRTAKETGKSKSVIHAALKNGDMSYVEKEGNRYKIDPAEVFRVFPPESENVQNEKKNTQKERFRTLKKNSKNNVLELEIELLNERIKHKDEIIGFKDKTIENITFERDEWKKQAQVLAISDQREDRSKEKQASQAFGKNRVGWYVTAAVTILFFVISVYAFSSGHISLVSPMNVFSVIETSRRALKRMGGHSGAVTYSC